LAQITTIRFAGPGPYGTSVFINNAAGYAPSTTSALTVDDTLKGSIDVRQAIAVSMDVYAKNTSVVGSPIQKLGTATAVGGATSITFNDGIGLRFGVNDNQELYVADPSFLAFGLATMNGFTSAEGETVDVCWSPRNEICYTFFISS
tara:strand:+ start:16045 stop:16485 length:441 start_codon:yes stop_codon:yes gene_type:complete